jgi:CheY-like chemotaxis protein/two-component sensor histidine kinase
MIINDLLDLSKIEANKLKLEENEFSPRQLIEQLTSLFSSALKNKRLELAIFINPHLPSLLKGDSVRLYQILTNLLSNAIKFTEQGTITVEANLAEENQEQVSIMFIISDTGKGIAKSNQSLLFEPYVQEDSSITRKFGGTGLGLSICKKLVELMKGEITLESEIDKGSRFSFTAKFNKALNLENQFNNENTKYLNGISSVVIGKYSIFTTTLIRQLTSWTLQCHTIEKIEDLIKNAPNFLFSQQNIPIIIWDIESINDQTVSFLNKIVNLPNFEFIILLIPFWEQNYFQKLPIKEKVVCLSKPLQPSKLFECLRKFTLKTRPSITRPYLEPLILEPIKENKEKSLLIVEDDEVNQFIIAKQLKHFGYTFDIANSGKEALIAVKNTSYKLFLLNFNLPDINCFELVAQIHKKELEKQEKLTKANHSIVVVLTADISLQEEQNLFEVGVDVFLRKPISTKMLEETLKKWL